jgi:RNA polymerase sigma-70 factor (ECF subfamily)
VYDEDAKLVQAALAGEREAFDKLVEQYQRQAVSVALRLVGNVDDALEVAQDGFVRAYQSLSQLKDAKLFGPWLMRIMSNGALNYRRNRSRHGAVSLSESSMQEDGQAGTNLEGQLPGDEPSAYERLAGKEMATALQEAIDELPENLRTALLLFAVEKRPQKEIADMMDCSVQMVKWNVFEARRRLRKRLQKALGE